MKESWWVSIGSVIVFLAIIAVALAMEIGGKKTWRSERVAKPALIGLFFLTGSLSLFRPQANVPSILHKLSIIMCLTMAGWHLHKWRKILKEEGLGLVGITRNKLGRCARKISDHLLKSS